MNKEALARIWEQEIVPVWSEPFGRGLLERLALPPKAQVLDLGCGTGYPLLALLDKLDDASRVIGVDPDGHMLDVARRRAGGLSGKRVFLKVEDLERLSFADEVFDVAVANLVLQDCADPRRVLSEVRRVLRPGGVLGVTRPLAGTFQEFFDLLREAVEAGAGGADGAEEAARARIEEHVRTYPTLAEATALIAEAGFEPLECEVRRFSLLFRSSREFFFAPVIEHGFLKAWKALLPEKDAAQRAFLWVKRALDTYYGGGPINVSVAAGVVTARRG